MLEHVALQASRLLASQSNLRALCWADEQWSQSLHFPHLWREAIRKLPKDVQFIRGEAGRQTQFCPMSEHPLFTVMLSYLCHVSISIYLGSPSAGFGNLMLFFSWYHPWFYFSHFSPHSWVALRVRSGIHVYKMNPLWCLARGLRTTPNNIILLTSLIYCPTIPSDYVIGEKGLCLNYIVIFTNPTQCVETRINSHSVHICWVPCMSESIQFSPSCSDRWSGIHVSN